MLNELKRIFSRKYREEEHFKKSVYRYFMRHTWIKSNLCDYLKNPDDLVEESLKWNIKNYKPLNFVK